jgi:hypothetical protein
MKRNLKMTDACKWAERQNTRLNETPATQAQLAALERRGVEIPRDLTKQQASDMLNEPTRKQRKLLKRHGRWVCGMTFNEASREIEALMFDWRNR